MFSFRIKETGIYKEFGTQRELFDYLFPKDGGTIYYLWDECEYKDMWEHTSIVKWSYKVYRSCEDAEEDEEIPDLIVWKG
jgi:hypothetical protein